MRSILLLLILINAKCMATDYYANTSSTALLSDGTLKNPFKTVSQIQNKLNSILPGDKLLLKRGETFTGHLFISNSGTAPAPITIGSYGSGALPKLIYDVAQSGTSPEDRWGIQVYYSKHIIIEEIEILDPGMDSTVHKFVANAGIGIYFDHSSYCIARNLKISGVGSGVAMSGNYNEVYNCNLSHLRMMKSTAAVDGKYGDDDYGATAIILYTASFCIIRNNYCEDNWGNSFDYGTDGGAIEIYYGVCDSNRIMYNSFIDCNGMTELGGGNGSACDNLFAYNKIINCSSLFGIHLPGSAGFPMDVQRLKFYNNIVIETIKQFNKPVCLVAVDGTTTAPIVLDMQNNIFYLLTNVNINAGCTLLQDALKHERNIYRFNGGSTGYPIHNTELITQVPLFANTSNTNPGLWDYHLAKGSPAISFGKNCGLTKDFKAAPVGSKPNAGIFESKLK